MGTEHGKQERTRKSQRDVIVRGLAGAMFALLGINSLLNADAWYLTVGGIVMLLAAATFVVQSIRSLRFDEHAVSD